MTLLTEVNLPETENQFRSDTRQWTDLPEVTRQVGGPDTAVAPGLVKPGGDRQPGLPHCHVGYQEQVVPAVCNAPGSFDNAETHEVILSSLQREREPL